MARTIWLRLPNGRYCQPPSDMPEYEIPVGTSIVDALVMMGCVKTRSEARRLVIHGAVTVWRVPDEA